MGIVTGRGFDIGPIDPIAKEHLIGAAGFERIGGIEGHRRRQLGEGLRNLVELFGEA